MKDLFEAASQIQGCLNSFNWKFCFIGGIAVTHWGEPRLTRNIGAVE